MWKSSFLFKLTLLLLLAFYCELSPYSPILSRKKNMKMFFVSKYGYCDESTELRNLSICKETNLSLDKDIVCNLIPVNYEFQVISSSRRIYSYKINNNDSLPSECRIESKPLPKILWINLKILSIYPTEKLDQFKFNILLTIKWTDPRLCYDKLQRRTFIINEKIHSELMSLLWTPHIVIDNIQSSKLNYFLQPVKNLFYSNDIITEYEPYFTQFTRYSFNIICEENSSFIGYPLDYKLCYFTIRLISKSNVCLRLLSYPVLNKHNTKFLSNYYGKLIMVKYSDCQNIEQECIKFTYGLMRNPSTLYLRIKFHTLLISIMAIIILIIPKTEYLSRISLLISSIVIFCTFVNKYLNTLQANSSYDLFSYMVLYLSVLLVLSTIEVIFTQIFDNIENNSENYQLYKQTQSRHRNYLVTTCLDKLRQYLDIDFNIFIMCDALYKPFTLLWLAMIKIKRPIIIIIRCTIILYFLLITLRHYYYYKEANNHYKKWIKLNLIKNLSGPVDLSNIFIATERNSIDCQEWFENSDNLTYYESLSSLYNPACLTDEEALYVFTGSRLKDFVKKRDGFGFRLRKKQLGFNYYQMTFKQRFVHCFVPLFYLFINC